MIKFLLVLMAAVLTIPSALRAEDAPAVPAPTIAAPPAPGPAPVVPGTPATTIFTPPQPDMPPKDGKSGIPQPKDSNLKIPAPLTPEPTTPARPKRPKKTYPLKTPEPTIPTPALTNKPDLDKKLESRDKQNGRSVKKGKSTKLRGPRPAVKSE